MKQGKIFSTGQRMKLERAQSIIKNLGVYGTRLVDGKSKPLGELMAKDIEHALEYDKDPDPKEMSEMIKLMKDAHSGDAGARQELSRLRIMSTYNYVTPNLHAALFFETVELADDERPAVQNLTKNEFTVRYVGQDGPAIKESRVAPESVETLIDLKDLITEAVEYPTRDIYLGDISRVSQAQFDLDFDLQNQWDGILWGLLNTSLGNFLITGKKSGRVYNANSRIQASQLPTSNDQQITGITGSTKFGQSTLDLAIRYFAGWAGTSMSGDLMPTGDIIMNPLDAPDILSGITFTNAMQNTVAQELLTKGWYTLPPLFGVNWRVIGDATLPRKKAYFRSNKPAGTIFLKPSRAEDVEEVDRRLGTAKRWKKLCFGSYISTVQRPNVLRVAYTT